MSTFSIAPADGTVRAPAGWCAAADLTQDAMLADPAFAGAESRSYGTPPWIHYHLPGGAIEGKPLLASLCFYDQLLVYVSFSADLYPPGPKDWSTYSLEVEAEMKRFHERVLTDMLGKPTRGGGIFTRRPPKGTKTLDEPVSWKFGWGAVGSYHDSRGGGTYMHVAYGNRLEECSRAYRSRRL